MKPYLIISFGMLVYAFAATGFLVPHKIVGGGATGIATVLFYLFKIPVGIGYFLVNILLLIIAMKVLGPKFGIKTIFAIIVGTYGTARTYGQYCQRRCRCGKQQ